MKSIIVGFFMSFFFLTSIHSQDKLLTVNDSINMFYNGLFEDLELNYLYTKKVDWAGIKSFIKNEALKSESFEESLQVTSQLFDTINGNHLLLFSEKNMYQSTLGKRLSASQFNQSLADAYENGIPFEVKILEDDYGYVLVPGMLLKDATRAELDEAAQEIYDAIIKIDQSHAVKGWIVDLRTNIGGNSNVMLAGLYHLLGERAALLDLDVNQNVSSLYSISDGSLYQNHEVLVAIKPSAKTNPTIPVALITSLITASAGEFVAMGFRTRNHTIVIGEESYGLTTANDLYELPFGTKAAITMSYGTDTSGKFTKTIIPDIEVKKQSNFEELAKDQNIIEAIKFINSKL